MKVSVIIAVYKDVQSLSLIITALKRQTYKNFEVIIAEDGENHQMREYIASISDLDVKHTTQEDIGVRKARSQNNGIIASSGEYLIFIDGDCVPYTTFVDAHVALAERGVVRSGRRLNLPEDLSLQMRSEKMEPLELEKSLWKYAPKLLLDKEARFKQGLYFNPKGWLYRNLIDRKNRSSAILGCNFSCFRDDMIAINGFDESYGETAVSDDMDLDWRFRAYGLKLRSCKNAANVMHLYHKAHDRGDASAQVTLMRERETKGLYRCEMGMNSHSRDF